jgi:hypothetical protein
VIDENHEFWIEIKAEEVALQLESLADADVVAVLDRVREFLVGANNSGTT